MPRTKKPKTRKVTVTLPAKPAVAEFVPNPFVAEQRSRAVQNWKAQCQREIARVVGGARSYSVQLREEKVVKLVADIEIEP